MYGTISRSTVKAGHVDDVIALMQEWERDFKPKVPGAIGALVYRLDADPNTLVMCAVFEDKKTYVANADNPEQDKWFRRLREHFTADPTWDDGEIVYAEGLAP